ncbi:sigma 54-interacting transcriptional regulator [Sedimentisphaera salicampi]|uniref:sigma 54-interacting transcriptional regulator n=1 Tax=Sedimentisphaera salicampi TaxID=1941349 RepID=UPI000B9B793A|nr:sigma 54-interacting transcriptional regulator [Sedimentisphaera salicampi]OXU14483.1 Arginine utilization regulatory protein RocR [Sedimentisphaera salicampi]
METLTKNELSFISSAFESVFANPFASDKGDNTLQDSLPQEELNEKLLQIIKRLEESGLELVQDFPFQEKGIAEKLFISSSYLRFAGKLSSKACEAFKAESPLSIDFGSEGLLSLEKHGFEKSKANRIFSSFFQLERAKGCIEDSISGHGRVAEDFRKQLWDCVFSSSFENYINFFSESSVHFPILICSQPGCERTRAAEAAALSGFIGYNEKKQSFKTDMQKLYASADMSGCREDEAESFIFGRGKGAFLWADSPAKGVLDKPSAGGIAFIDGIENLTARLAEKLRLALETGFCSPAGETKRNALESRVFAGLTEDTSQLGSGLKMCFAKTLTVPPLRERIDQSRDNLALIASKALEQCTGISNPEAAEKLSEQLIVKGGLEYSWPENERELSCFVKSFLLSGGEELISESDNSHGKDFLSSRPTAAKLLSDYCKMLYEEYGSYEQAARTAGLDRRTAKKYIEMDETARNEPS